MYFFLFLRFHSSLTVWIWHTAQSLGWWVIIICHNKLLLQMWIINIAKLIEYTFDVQFD